MMRLDIPMRVREVRMKLLIVMAEERSVEMPDWVLRRRWAMLVVLYEPYCVSDHLRFMEGGSSLELVDG